MKDRWEKRKLDCDRHNHHRWKTVLSDGASGISESGPGSYPGCLWKNGC